MKVISACFSISREYLSSCKTHKVISVSWAETQHLLQLWKKKAEAQISIFLHFCVLSYLHKHKPLIKVNRISFSLTFLSPCTTPPLSIMSCMREKQLLIAWKRWRHIRASLGLLIHCTQSARHEDNNTHSPSFFTPHSLSFSCLFLSVSFLSFSH